MKKLRAKFVSIRDLLATAWPIVLITVAGFFLAYQFVEPAPPQHVLAHATRLGGFTLPPALAWDDPGLDPLLRRFHASNKRIDSRGTRQALQWQPRFRSYREGLADAWEAGDGVMPAH